MIKYFLIEFNYIYPHLSKDYKTLLCYSRVWSPTVMMTLINNWFS